MPRRSRRGRARRVTRGHEWIGGSCVLTSSVTDADPPVLQIFVLWLESDGPGTVGQEVVAPEEAEGAIGGVLLDAFERPSWGAPRRPDSLRVADSGVAAELRAAVRSRGLAIPVEVAPTPELDSLIVEIIASPAHDGGQPSYLESGAISPPVMRELFVAAWLLYRTAPWKVAEGPLGPVTIGV
jgi:hypothetical protein